VGVPSDRRRTPRAAVTLQCTLHRRVGSAIDAETVDIGPGGMCVSCARPLAADEVLRFDLPLTPAERLDGRARVLRQEGHNRYALRFEHLMEPALEQLRALAA
jgi:PilZ domain